MAKFSSEVYKSLYEAVEGRGEPHASRDVIPILLISGVSVTIVTRLQAGRPGFISQQGQWRKLFLFSTASRTDLKPSTQPPIQCVRRALSQGVKRPRREADHSPPSSTELKSAWSYTSTPSESSGRIT